MTKVTEKEFIEKCGTEEYSNLLEICYIELQKELEKTGNSKAVYIAIHEVSETKQNLMITSSLNRTIFGDDFGIDEISIVENLENDFLDKILETKTLLK